MSHNINKPGYKHTSLGWIPDEWTVRSLSQSILAKGDYGINAAAVEYSDGLPAYLRITDIDGDGIFCNDKRKSVADSNYKQFILDEGDIVFVRTGATVGKTYLYNKADGQLVFAGFLIRFKTDSDILIPYYLKFYTLTKPYWDWVKTTCTRSGQPGINSTEYGQLKIPMPTVTEQLKIVNVIKVWDEAIQKTQQLIEQLKKRNKGLVQQLLAGKIRLKGFGVKWEQIQVRKIAKEVSLKNRADKTLTVLSCTKYHGLVDSLEYFGRRVFSEDTSTYKVVPEGHFAYATNHIEEGSIGYQSKYEEALISPMYTVFKTTAEVDDNYLYKVLKSQHYIHEYQKRMEGSIDRRGGLRWDEFSKIPLHLPPYEEQAAIAKLLDEANNELKLNQQQLANLQQQKKGLMQKLLSGEVRVKIDN